MNIRRIVVAIVASVLMVAGGVAAPASAAPRTVQLPKACASTYGATKVSASEVGAIVKANVHPRSGSEYVFTVDCETGGRYFTHLVVTNAKGSIIHNQRMTQSYDLYSEVVGASARKGVTFYSTQAHRDFTYYERKFTAKWSKSAKKFTVKKAAVPGYVKPVDTFAKQVRTGKTFTSTKLTKAAQKKVRAFNKKADRSGQRWTNCVTVTANRGLCTIGYLSDDNLDMMTFNISKVGKTFKVANIDTQYLSLDDPFLWSSKGVQGMMSLAD